MNKKLAKVIMMSLICASVMPSVGCTQEITSSYTFNNIDIFDNTGIAIEVVDDNSNDNVVITFASPQNTSNVFASGDSAICNNMLNANKTVIFKGNDINVKDKGFINSYISSINNSGNMKVDNAIAGESNNHVFLNNTGVLNVNNFFSVNHYQLNGQNDVFAIANTNGTMNINSSFVVNTMTSETTANGGTLYKNGLAIENYNGMLFIEHTVNPNTTSVIGSTENIISINGDIATYQGGNTTINLSGYTQSISGAIHVDDTSTVNLKLEDGATWRVSENQIHTMKGLEVNSGFVQLLNSNDFINLRLENFKTDGKFTHNSGFVVMTDLANDKGNCVEFVSTVGNNNKVTVPFIVQDVLDYTLCELDEVTINDVITPSQNHSVTIATAAQSSNVDVKAMGNTYKNSNTLFVPVVNKVENSGLGTSWNFVGWEPTEIKRNGDDLGGASGGEESDIMQIDIDNTFKRLNELRRDIRTDPSEVGVWMRGETGETKIGSYSYDYNLMSGGYDWHKENEAGILFTGVGFSYATNDCDDAVIGDTKSYGMNLYGSWYGKAKNEYVDLILRYGKLDKEYAGLDRNGVFVSGDYDKDMFSIAAKYGRRIYKDDWYWEPSVGLTCGRVGSADFIDNLGTNIHADSTNSLITSLGMQVGKNIKGIEYYGKAEVMHDFDGKIHVSAPGIVAEDDMGGTWVKCAIGASRKIDENNSFYLEVERDFGNKVEKPYGFSAGYRFTW